MIVLALFNLNRFGRRKVLIVTYILSGVGAISALLLTDKAEHDKGKV